MLRKLLEILNTPITFTSKRDRSSFGRAIPFLRFKHKARPMIMQTHYLSGNKINDLNDQLGQEVNNGNLFRK